MTDELVRLLDLPATALIAAVGNELQVLTVTHVSADEVTVKRRHLGTSIDLGDLLETIGLHGLAMLPPSHIQVSEIAAPQLPAPAEAATAPLPTTRRTTRHHTPPVVAAPNTEVQSATEPTHACPQCPRMFISGRSLGIHLAMTHRAETPKQAAERAKARAPIERVPCPHCPKTFDPRGLGPHIAKAHKPAPVVAPPELPAPEPPVEPQTYACTQCTRTFRSQKMLDHHIAIVHWETETPVAPEPPAERPVVDPNGICDICRRPVSAHERCEQCGKLLGMGHVAGVVHIVINGKTFCENCDTVRANSRLVRTS